MSGFIEWLEELNRKDTRVRAVLRRSLSFAPGVYSSAYPYVEPFLKNEADNSWRRQVHYLVAGLWASHWYEGVQGNPDTLAKACFGHYQAQGSSPSVERRFITLLDADQDQLPYRLRQMVTLLKDYPLDFGVLLRDLLSWTSEKKWTQNRWAQDFYRNWQSEEETETLSTKEKVQ
jgi:CRISPR system Cascade subunit CasB